MNEIVKNATTVYLGLNVHYYNLQPTASEEASLDFMEIRISIYAQV